MLPASSWVPIRWPSEWRDPSLLDLLSGTPVNCVVLDWSDPKASLSVAGEARSDGLAVVALLPDGGDPGRIGAAEAAGVSALACPAAIESKLPVIPWSEKTKLPWDSKAPVLVASDAVWPGVRMGQGGEGGPTGLPWIDSNGWWLRMARARAPEKTVWVAAQPPADTTFIRPQHYALAIADAYAHGGRAVLSLDSQLRTALATRAETAIASWKSIMAVLGFFTAHTQWRRFEPLGTLGVISGFAGEDEDFAGEVLNLLARRGTPYRVIPKQRAPVAGLDSFQAVVYADQKPAEGELLTQLVRYVAAGGLLIAGAKWPRPSGTAVPDTYRRFDVYGVGKGRLAISREDPPDPFQLAGDAQLLLSFRNVPVRLFNTGTLSTFYTGSADGSRAVLHVINYAMRPFGHPVSAAFTTKYRHAEMWSPGLPMKELELSPTLDGGVEVHLPPFNVYAAIELEA